MEDKNLPYPFFHHFTYYSPPSLVIKKFIFISFPILKCSSQSLKKTFVVQTMTFQPKLPSHCVFHTHTAWL